MSLASVITAAGWTVEAVAGKLGLSPTLFVRIDAGRQALPIDVAEAIARVIGVAVAEVVTAAGRASGISSVHVPFASKAVPVRPDLGEPIPTVRLAPVPGFELPPRVAPAFRDRVWLSTMVPANGTSEGYIGCVDCSTRSLVGVAFTAEGSNVGAVAWNGAGIVWGMEANFLEVGGIWQALTSDPNAAPSFVSDLAFGTSRAACNAGADGMFKGNFIFAGEAPVFQVQGFDGVTGAAGPWCTMRLFGPVFDVIAFGGLLYALQGRRIHEIAPSTMTILRTSIGLVLKAPARLAVANDPAAGEMAVWAPQWNMLAHAPLSTLDPAFFTAPDLPVWGEGICSDPDGNLWVGVLDGEVPGIGRFNPALDAFDGVITDFGPNEAPQIMNGNAFVVALHDGAVWAVLVLANWMTESRRIVAVRIDPATVAITNIVTVRAEVSWEEQVSHATMEVVA